MLSEYMVHSASYLKITLDRLEESVPDCDPERKLAETFGDKEVSSDIKKMFLTSILTKDNFIKDKDRLICMLCDEAIPYVDRLHRIYFKDEKCTPSELEKTLKNFTFNLRRAVAKMYDKLTKIVKNRPDIDVMILRDQILVFRNNIIKYVDYLYTRIQ